MVERGVRIDFRHDEGNVRFLAERGRIVDNHAACRRRNGGEFQGNATARTEQGDVYAFKGFLRQFFHSQHFSTEGYLFARGTGGGQKLQGADGKVACFQAGQDLDAHRSGGANDGNMGCLVHDCVRKWRNRFRMRTIVRVLGGKAIRDQVAGNCVRNRKIKKSC